MNIDTNELRKMGYRKMMLAQSQIADELDRLYTIEAANKPMTREQIEARIIGHGYEKIGDNMFVNKKTYSRCDFHPIAFSDKEEHISIRGEFVLNNFPLSRVTSHILDAVIGSLFSSSPHS